MLEIKDLGKIKKFYFYDGSVKVGLVTAVRDEDNSYRYHGIAEVLLEDGEIRNIMPDSLGKVTFAKNIDPELREHFEALGKIVIKETRKQVKLEKELSEASNNLRSSRILEDREKVNVGDKIAEIYVKNNNLISFNQADEIMDKVKTFITENVMTADSFNSHSVDFSSFKTFDKNFNISIPIESIKYAQEGDFGGLIFLEYDNSMNVYDDEDLLNNTTDFYLSKKGYSLKKLRAAAEKLSNKNFEIKINPCLSVGDKTTTLYVNIEFSLIKFKRDRDHVDEIAKTIKELLKK